jgi:hypothetical protein
MSSDQPSEERHSADLTHFERGVLDALAENFGSNRRKFLRQIEGLKVVERENTGHGFYTRVKVDGSECRAIPINMVGGTFKIAGIDEEIGIILWEKEGFLSQIEGFSYGDPIFQNLSLEELKYGSEIGGI